jgi:SprT-like protein
MDNQSLQEWVEEISLRDFGLPFVHKAIFNTRLSSTGGRYFTKTHHIEISSKQLEVHGKEEVERIIKHELCHYHLHIQRKGYRHRDADFKLLLRKVGGSRYCSAVPGASRRELFRYKLECVSCGMAYFRKRKVNVRKYACGQCRSKLKLVEIAPTQNPAHA